MYVTNGGALATGGGFPNYNAPPAPPAGGPGAPPQGGGVTGFLKSIAGGIDWSGIFGQSAHEREHIATIRGLYERAVGGDAAAYRELHYRMTAKWVDEFGPGSAPADKWLRPEHERELARQALQNLATNTEFVATVAANPLYAEVKRVAQDLRDDLASAVGRIGAGATQAAVNVVAGPDGAAGGGAVIPLSRSQLLIVAGVAGVLLVLALRKRGG